MSKNTFTNDNIKIREALRALGFLDDKIGWDGRNVTYDNMPAINPEDNIDGTTSAGANNFISGVNKIYKNGGRDDSLSDVTSMASMSGLGNTIEYGEDGVVTLGGIKIPNAIVIDGQAYAPKSDIRRAVESAKNAGGIVSPNDSFNNSYGAEGKYTSKIRGILDDLVNGDDFSYSPEEDQMYDVYKKMYEREGKKAMDNTYGNGAGKTGGYANSAAIAAGNQAYFDYMEKLNDKIPQLEAQAYNRYMEDYNKKLALLKLYGTPKEIYEFEQKAQEKMFTNVNDALNDNYKRNKDVQENNQIISETGKDWDYKNKQFDYKKQQDGSNAAYKESRDALSDARYDEKTAYDKMVKEKELQYKAEANARANEKQQYDIPLLQKKLMK